jgi:hypothetical protein
MHGRNKLEENSRIRDQTDTTLMKYFLPEEINNTKQTKLDKPRPEKLPPEKILKFFSKSIKLRNALKQCYWDRTALYNKVLLFY